MPRPCKGGRCGGRRCELWEALEWRLLTSCSSLESFKVEVVERELPSRSLKAGIDLRERGLQLGKGICPHYETLKQNMPTDCKECAKQAPGRSMAHCWALWQRFPKSACSSSCPSWLCSGWPPRLPQVQLCLMKSLFVRRNLFSQLLRNSRLGQNLIRLRLGQAANIATRQAGKTKKVFNNIKKQDQISFLLLSLMNVCFKP